MSASVFLPIVLTVGGLFMLIKLRFFFLVHPLICLKSIRSALSDKQTRRGMYLALAGTLGVGNILGVAVGIFVGGAGSVFWIAVSSIFAAVLKYSESALSGLNRSERSFGMPAVLISTFPRVGKGLASVYCFFGIILALFMGAALQASSLASLLQISFNIPKGCVALFLAIFVVCASRSGGDSIKGWTEVLVPIATLTYVILTFLVIVSNVDRLPEVFSSIFNDAFSLSGLKGGAFGFVMSQAIREGFSRGLLSNEAGAGTSSLAQSEKCSDAHSAGLLGILEVVVDTLVLCTLSGIAILSVGIDETVEGGTELLFLTIGDAFGSASMLVLTFSVAIFVFSTVICWMYYGRSYERMLLKKNYGFSVIFTAAVVVGSFINEAVLVSFSDVTLLILSVLTILSIVKCSDRIRDLSEHSIKFL